MDKKVKKWIDEHDGDEYCNYCKYQSICIGGIKSGPNGPICPPCSDREDFIDEDSLIETIKNGDEEI